MNKRKLRSSANPARATRKRKSSFVRLFSVISDKRRTKKDNRSRKRAEYRATLPKHPLKRFFFQLHPKRIIKYWFSKDGLRRMLKIVAILLLCLVLFVGGLFAYYRKDLDAIRPGEIDKRVQSTVTKYLDRNGEQLWEDKGTGDYTLVVKSEQINDTMKKATIAIEDKDFYKHSGVSFTGITRAALSNAQGNVAQGGSTLTQQLVKLVFFAKQAHERGLEAIPRKIKEMILAIEVERMYNKDQILTLYLNESPYGGRRNGVESAAQTYFGKSAKELTLAESALLAAIPNNPSVYNPYNTAGHPALISRQHKVLEAMVDMKYITRQQADEAKKVGVIDTLKPLSDQLDGVIAPHFVLMVKGQLEDQLGKTLVGNGGLTVKTTLDLATQRQLEATMSEMFNGTLGRQECGGNCPAYSGFKNGAAAVEDTQTGQLIALLGSKDYKEPGYGENNAAMSFLQPGSSIKPLVYAQLFQKQAENKPNWGAGSILPDVKTNFGGGYSPNNADLRFDGNITLREALNRSRNIPAIKAMQTAGKDETWGTIRELGDKDYCTVGADADAGLSSAIGSCGTRLVDHVNAVASLGRLGAYVPQTTILEVLNSNGESLLKAKNDKPKQVIDPQAAYIVNDILADRNSRARLLGVASLTNINGNGIRASVKTGTSDISINGRPFSKDLWAIGYTPSLAMAVWLGNPDNTPLTVGRGNSRIPMYMIDQVITETTKRYKESNKLAADYWERPAGIQTINGDIYPSYFNKANAPSNIKMDFDKMSKKKAGECTPPGAKESVSVMRMIDPVTKREVFTAPDGYDATTEDNVHACGDAQPTVQVAINKGSLTADISYKQGKFGLQSLEVQVNGAVVRTLAVASGGSTTVPLPDNEDASYTVTARLIDSAYYESSASATYSP